MDDLISRSSLLNKMKSVCDNCGNRDMYNGAMCRACLFDDAISYVEDEPTIEKGE